MKKKLLKFFIIIGVLALLLTLISTTRVQAVTLQANPNTHYKGIYAPTDWIIYFRDMEKTGGALGLSEKIDSKTLLPTSNSNNLDSHMVKSTEYGAAAILSASGYGNFKKIQESEIKTTTGNETGVYFDVSTTGYNIVAGGLSPYIFPGVNERYYDQYGDSTTAKVGDALGTKDTKNPGCTGWHFSNCQWVNNTFPYFICCGESIFSYWIAKDPYVSRGVVVCGEGL